jgi:hypothetical protein
MFMTPSLVRWTLPHFPGSNLAHGRPIHCPVLAAGGISDRER